MPVTPRDTSGNGSATALEHMLKGTAPQVSHILNNALEGQDISVEDALVLFEHIGSGVQCPGDDRRRASQTPCG